MTSLPRQFLIVALCAGVASSNAAVGLPLLADASEHPASLIGLLLALIPLGTALGALIAAPLRNRLGSAGETLAMAAAVTAVGCLSLMTSTAVAILAIGATLVGLGSGMFWVCSQVLLSANSGDIRGKSAFLTQYAVYTTGMLLGSVLTGALVACLEAIGIDVLAASRASPALGLAVSAIAYTLWSPKRRSIHDAAGRAVIGWRLLTNGLSLQVPDLFVVSALSLVSLLAPLVLLDTFSFTPFMVGITVGAIALGKITGTVFARYAAGAFGSRAAILTSLIVGLVACPILALTEAPALFAGALLLASLAITGIWPLIVAEAHSRTPSTLRGHAAVAWNIREYAAIAASGVAGTWLYSSLGRPAMFITAALLLLFATISTARALGYSAGAGAEQA